MNKQQRAFCIEYVKNGLNGFQAYKKTYKTKNDDSARISASQLLTNPNIKAYIAELQGEVEEKAIMGIKERQEFLTRIVNGEEAETYITMAGAVEGKPNLKTRLNALDILNKMSGSYTEKREITINKPKIIIDDLTENGED